MQNYQGFLPETPAAPINHFPDAPIDFTTVKGVYKNCRGIWAAQWTDERGQRHTKYFNPKFFVNEQTARVEAYKFKIAIQREIEAKGGVQRKRPHTVRARQAAGRRAEYELLPTSGRRIRRSGGSPSSFSSIYCSDYTNASPELLAMLQSVNVAGLAGDPAVTEPILTWQSGIPTSMNAAIRTGFSHQPTMMWSSHRGGGVDNLYRTGESVDGAQLSERMLDGFGGEVYYWPPNHHPQQRPPVGYNSPTQQLMSVNDYWSVTQPNLCANGQANSCLDDLTMETWWAKPQVKLNALPLFSEPLRKNVDDDNALPSVAITSMNGSCSRSAPPPSVLKKTMQLNEHSAPSFMPRQLHPINSSLIVPMIESTACHLMEEASAY